MPPKNAQDAAAKKADAAKRAKKLEDATFGLKNKKGAKAQQCVLPPALQPRPHHRLRRFVETLKKTVEANTTAKQQRLALADPNSKEARAVRPRRLRPPAARAPARRAPARPRPRRARAQPARAGVCAPRRGSRDPPPLALAEAQG